VAHPVAAIVAAEANHNLPADASLITITKRF
jgi:hypothetical protein